MTPQARAIFGELTVLWLGTLLLIRGVVSLVQGVGAPELLLAAVPILFMYAPVWACRLRGADPWDYPMALPAFSERQVWVDMVRLNAYLLIALAVPFTVGYHFWQTGVFGFSYVGTLPEEPLKVILYHLFFVAVPEEMFYRGYMQTRLDELWGKRWSVFGVLLGPGWLVTCFVFAIGHSVVQVQWWHIFIVFPSLIFGWLRERTGSIVAGALFHAICNIGVAFLDTLYGIVPP